MRTVSMLYTTLISLSALATASPVTFSSPERSNFYLVTTTQATPAANSSQLHNVSLTTLFDPYYQPNYLLRLIEPGYNSVPTFNISNGTLHCREQGAHGIGTYVFNSTAVHSGGELQFLAQNEGHGELSLKHGYLLAVNGSAVGWTICVEELGQRVIEYKGTDQGCTPTYIQAVNSVPY